jgi:RNA-binding protein YhbY
VKEIINQVIHGKVHLHIGKAGITPQLLEQVDNLLKKRSVIKVKLLNLMEFDNAKIAFHHFSMLTNTNVVDIRGKTGVLARIGNQ